MHDRYLERVRLWLGEAEAQVLKKFSGLDDDDRLVGFAIAWSLEPFTPSKLVETLATWNLRSSSGRRFAGPGVKRSIARLEATGALARAGSGQGFTTSLSHAVALLAASDPSLRETFAGLRLPSEGRYGSYVYYHSEGSPRRYVEIRNRCFSRDWQGLEEALGLWEQRYRSPVVWPFLLSPFDPALVLSMPPRLRALALRWCVEAAIEDMLPLPEIAAVLDEAAAEIEDWLDLGSIALASDDPGAFAAAEAALAGEGAEKAAARSALAISHAYHAGEDGAAIAAFETWRVAMRKATRKRKIVPRGFHGVWAAMAFLRRAEPGDLEEAETIIALGMAGHRQTVEPFNHLENILALLRGKGGDKLSRWLDHQFDPKRKDSAIRVEGAAFMPDHFYLLATARLVDLDDKTRSSARLVAQRLAAAAAERGWAWIAREAEALATGKVPEKKSVFAMALRKADVWEHQLLGLESLAKGLDEAGPENPKRSGKHLAWILAVAGDGHWSLSPLERTVNARGVSSTGRRVALARLKNEAARMEFLNDQDRAAASYIREVNEWGWRSGEHVLDDPRALVALTGHPYVYANQASPEPMEIVLQQPRLSLTKAPQGGLRLALSPEIDYSKGVPMPLFESRRRCVVVDAGPLHRDLHERLGNSGAVFPEAARERVVAAASRLAAKVGVESDDIETRDASLGELEGDPRPVLRLVPLGEGLSASLLVRPVSGQSREEAPGSGSAILMTVVEGRPVRVRRDREAELAAASRVLEACPSLAAAEEGRAAFAFVLPSPLDCLELLAELHACEDLRVEWPEGEGPRVRAVVDSSHFKVSLGGGGDWLTAAGELRVDDDLVLSMRELLSHLDQPGAKPGFIQLRDGQFLALAESFRRQLEDLRAFSQPSRDGKLRIHPLAAGAFSDWVESGAAKVGKAWREQLERLRAAASAPPATPPSTLQAELRPYQLEGYRWLRRLADAGMGACLADDMGLGKTVQALALLIDRAAEGPALVVAPTSVAANWYEEARRFAPTLRPTLYGRGGAGCDREALLEGAGPFDLVIVSYGLLQSDAEAFASRRWRSVVLDEAQQIKNRATKRHQAAAKLEADFRLITTGTPVENRLAELHALFSFANPGLLGSWERFRDTFADPIERDEDAAARDRLRRLVRPFLLRRLKANVLQDLPERTEITLQVELSPEESAFYEALRRKAVEDLESAAQGAGGAEGGGAIRILAQLTRLRRACCHPSLVDPSVALPGSKLAVFVETLEELLAGGHKALVFSQFVDHLSILRRELDRLGTPYQYLDGSTPPKKRGEAVAAFQRGEGEVFLISLKAGGFGLNLTAADYVIHMDPWWNPAAEDQASDRVHRIGQTRPVTIYRLVAVGTVEEKITALHRRKRELADSILEGSDTASRLSAEDLLALLRD